MDFAFTDEQKELRAAARAYLADRFGPERVAVLADSDTGWDPASWKEITELGWLDAELGPVEQAVLAEETGYALYQGPFLTTVAFARPAYRGSWPEHPTTLAWLDSGTTSLRDPSGTGCLAEYGADGWRLTGPKHAVTDATTAGEAVVLAQGPSGPALWRVDLTEHRNVVRELSTLDRTRRLGDLHLDGTPAEPLVDAPDTEGVLRDVRRRAYALLACEAVGVARRALDLATGHVQERHQFDRPVAAFQGVSHRIANIYTAVQLARSLALRAAWCVAADDPADELAATTARVSAGHAAEFACENAIQAMGGIGFTWDHPLHRYYKRAQWINAFDGAPWAHRAELAGWILDQPATAPADARRRLPS